MLDISKKGFTLIELLIVVAIIAILAAIAIPNFLAAQVRSKVSRAKADMRTIGTGLESYRTDNDNYPDGYDTWDPLNPDSEPLYLITTPIAYLTSIPRDPFFIIGSSYILNPYTKPGAKPYWYWGIPRKDPNFGLDGGYFRQCGWRVASAGPDAKHGAGTGGDIYEINWLDYDPTNGTISRGEIMRWGPGNSEPIPF